MNNKNNLNIIIALQSIAISNLVTNESLRIMSVFIAVFFGYMFLRNWAINRSMPQVTQGKSITFTPDDLPPDIAEKMKDVNEFLVAKVKEENGLVEHKKCDNPHCKNCWGLGDE